MKGSLIVTFSLNVQYLRVRGIYNYRSRIDLLRDYRRAFPEGHSFYFRIRKQTNSRRVPRFVCNVETSCK